MSRIFGMILAVLTMVFYMVFGSSASAAERAEFGFQEVATSLVQSAKLTAVIEHGPAGIEDRALSGVPHNALSKSPMAPMGTRIPDAPLFYFGMFGIDEENRVLVGFDMVAEKFVPVSPVRILVNNTRTPRDIVAQAQTTIMNNSTDTLALDVMSEIHNVTIKLPGRLGNHWIRPEVDFTAEYYFAVDHIEPIEPLGTLFNTCFSGDAVKMYFAFDVFDGKFPATPSISVNARGLVPVEPATVERRGFFDFVTFKITSKDYNDIASDGDWLFVLNAGPGETEVSFYDWVPSLEETPSCVESSPTATKRRGVR